MSTDKKIVGYMLTTVDNPFDPREDYNEWLNYDEKILGYYTNETLGRVAKTAPNLTPLETFNETTRAMDALIRLTGGDFYRKLPVYE